MHSNRRRERPSRTRLAHAIAAVAAGLLACACSKDDAAGTPAAPAPAGGGSRSKYIQGLPLHIDGDKLSIGDVPPCTRELVRTVPVRNTSKNPVEVLGYAPNCGCINATLKGPKTIGPGESRDLELVIHPSGYGERSYRVEFASSGGLVGMARIDFRIWGGVHAVPPAAEHHASAKPEAFDFEIRSEDGKAFRVLSLDPPVGEIVQAAGPVAKVRLSTFEIDQWAASMAGGKSPAVERGPDGAVQQLVVKVVTDDPACPETQLTVSYLP
jgi:hypothetical protein